MTDRRQTLRPDGPLDDAPDGRRLVRIYRVWKRLSGGRSFAASRSWWSSLDGDAMGLGLTALVVALAAPVEATLWGVDWDQLGIRRVGRVDGLLVGCLLVSFWLPTALFVDRLVARRVAEKQAPSLWFRSVRGLIAGFPGLGIASIPVWRRLAETGRPRWAYGARRRAVRRPRWWLPRSWWVRRSVAIPERGALALWVGGIVALLTAVVWLASPEELSPERRAALVCVAVLLHGLGFVGTVSYLRVLRRRVDAPGWLLFAGCWFLPLPLALGALIPLGLDPDRTRQETLSWTAYSRHNQPGRFGRWSALEGAVRGSWRETPWWLRWTRPAGRGGRSETTAADRELLRLAASKQSLLSADAVAAGWILMHLGETDPVPLWLVPLVLVLLLGTGAGLLVVLGGHLAVALRILPGDRALGWLRQTWSVAIALGILAVGIMVGAALAAGEGRLAGVTLVYGGLFAMFVLAFGVILQVPMVIGGRKGFDLALSWSGVFLGLMILGAFVAASPVVADGLLLVALLAPLWHLGMVWRERPRLERCLGAQRGVPTGGGRLRTGVPPVARAILWLPFGGLAVAWWLRLRDRIVRTAGRFGRATDGAEGTARP